MKKRKDWKKGDGIGQVGLKNIEKRRIYLRGREKKRKKKKIIRKEFTMP